MEFGVHVVHGRKFLLECAMEEVLSRGESGSDLGFKTTSARRVYTSGSQKCCPHASSNHITWECVGNANPQAQRRIWSVLCS